MVSLELAFLAFSSCVAALATPLPRGITGANDPMAQTSQGPITGHPASKASSVVEFLGIPYAQPPLGDLRFAPPAKYTGNAPYVASEFGFDCPLHASPPVNFPGFTPQAPRIIAEFATGTGTPQSEDCLTLNIWSKRAEASCAPKTVLVFAYGGRFTIGNTDNTFYDGQYLADAQDVIVVTFNYRLNIFGFPGAPDASPNLGLRDQRLAIEWLRDNIASFGGNPNKITFFGQSSGAVAVDWWSYAYTTDPIVNGIISQSGNAFSFPLNPPNITTRNWYNVSATVGCGSSGDTLACMRQKNWTAIEAAAAKIKPTSGGSPVRSIPAFYPVVDDEIVFSDYLTRSAAGQFAKLPYLLGNNNNEQGYYVIPVYANGVNVTQAQGDEFLLQSFTCPNSVEANNRHNAGVPVWQYRYFGDWNNLRLYPTSGAYHGSDLEMVFGADQDVSGIPPSSAEVQTTQLMQKAWASFAQDPARGLQNVMGWPQFDPSENTLIRLAYNNNPIPHFVRPSVYDAPCSTITLGVFGTAAAKLM